MLTLRNLLTNSFVQRHCFLDVGRSVGAQSIHTSTCLSGKSFTRPPPPNVYVPKNQRKDPPSDFLPFPWVRKEKNNLFRDSGDYVQTIEVDPTLPKPDFEFSEELKTANESVKHYFSVATATYAERREVCRRQTIKRIQRHPMDFDSLEVKIAERTVQVRNLFDHAQRIDKRDVRNTRIALPILIQKRNGLLRKLWIMDQERFDWITKELQIYLLHIPFGVQKVRYTRKNDMRRMTKEYCEKMINDKRTAYHETLKKEQELFKEEKEQALAWIAEEEQAIKALDAYLESH